MGQEVDMVQVEAFARVLDDQWVSYIEAGVLKKRAGNRVPIFQPVSLHRAGDGRW
jgi:crotonobetainyl-CoA:carnitine CoA-transferase CaiB-like acyl-CoA transferase